MRRRQMACFHVSTQSYVRGRTPNFERPFTPQNQFQSLRNSGNIRFKRFPTNHFSANKNWSANTFETTLIFRTLTAPKRSDNGVERSGIIREHSGSKWNARKSSSVGENHSTIVRKQPNIVEKPSMDDHVWMIIHG